MPDKNFTDTLQELDAGVLLKKLSNVVNDVALGVVGHNKKGQITLTLKLDRIGESTQVQCEHKIAYSKPTLRGKITEEDTTTTPMHVSRKGHLSVAPDTQVDLFNESGDNADNVSQIKG